MITIDNLESPNKCPLCQSYNILSFGPIFYGEPTYYSSVKIQLLKQPELWQCQKCNSRFTKNIIPRLDSIEIYSRGSSSERWKATCSFEKEKTSKVISTLRKLLKPRTRILDIGCNTGELLDFARQQGCETFGVEYSQSGLKVAESKGHTVFVDLKNIEEKFNTIVAFDLIEHIYDVPKFLCDLYDLLEPQGHIVFLTGNTDSLTARLLKANWWYVRFPEHIVFPSRKFFKMQKKFEIRYWLKVYHSRSFQSSPFAGVRFWLSCWIREKWSSISGLPAVEPDHILIVLRKK